MNGPGSGLAAAEQQIRAAEARVARQAALAEGFDLAGDAEAAERARETLAVLEVGLALARFWEFVEVAFPGDGPDRQARPDA